MPWVPSPYAVFAFVAAGVSAVVGGVAWRNRAKPHAVPFGGLMAAITAWSLVYGVQIGFTTPAEQAALQRVGIAIGGTIPTLWLLFVVRYGGFEEWLGRGRLALLAVEPVAFGALVLTNPAHGLAWKRAGFSALGPAGVVELAFGPGYLVHIAYAYLLVSVGLAGLVLSYLRSSVMYRGQVGVLLLGALPPFVANVAYTLGIGPVPGLDLTPFAFVLTGVCFSLGLFQFDLLDRTPVAQRRALAETGDGFVVVDTGGTVVDANETARRVLDPPPEVDESLSATFPDADLAALDGRTLSAVVDGTRRTYELRVSAFHDHRDRVAGNVVVIRDVTERHAYERQLEVANRVLRHNLRNDVNVILGYADILEREVGDGNRAVREIKETGTGLIELGERTREAIRIQ